MRHLTVKTRMPCPTRLLADLNRLARENPHMRKTLEDAITFVATLNAKLAEARAVLDDMEVR